MTQTQNMAMGIWSTATWPTEAKSDYESASLVARGYVIREFAIRGMPRARAGRASGAPSGHTARTARRGAARWPPSPLALPIRSTPTPHAHAARSCGRRARRGAVSRPRASRLVRADAMAAVAARPPAGTPSLPACVGGALHEAGLRRGVGGRGARAPLARGDGGSRDAGASGGRRSRGDLRRGERRRGAAR